MTFPIRLGVDSYQTKTLEIGQPTEDLGQPVCSALRQVGGGEEVLSPRSGYFVCKKRRTKTRPATILSVEVQQCPLGSRILISSSNAEMGAFPGDRIKFDYGESINNVCEIERALRRTSGVI